MTLKRVTQVAVVGIGGDIRLLVGGDNVEAFGSIACIVRSDERRGGIIHQDYILQSLLLTEADDGFGQVTGEGGTFELRRPLSLSTGRSQQKMARVSDGEDA